MKNILLFSIAAVISLNLSAQNRIQVTSNIRNISLKKPMYFQNEYSPAQSENPDVNKGTKTLTEEQIGITTYDLQTNSSVDHRCYLYPDGTIGTTYTFGMNPTNYLDRGTGYNYFDGNFWLPEPTARIESIRTGWPSYSHLGTNGEVVIAHDGTQLVMNKRNTKGTGVWIQSLIPTPVGTAPYWSRIAVSGNTIHVLAAHMDTSAGGPIYQGQKNSLLYYRSQDGGTTWDIQAQILPGLSASDGYTQGYGGDCYAWAEPIGDTIAFVVGNSWTDLNLMKSIDGGTTWNKTIIFQHPYFNFQENHTLTPDSPYVCDGHLAVSLDTNGKAHIVFGIMRVLNGDTTDALTSYFPATDGLAYWKEGNSAFANLDPNAVYTAGKLIAWVHDHNGDGVIFDNWQSSYTFPDYGRGGLTSQPQISIDTNGDIYVVYTSIVEDMITGAGEYFTHIWGRRYKASQNSWSDIIELLASPDPTDYDGVEMVYPSLSKTMDSQLHIVYQFDFEPGVSLTLGEQPAGINVMMYLAVDKTDFFCSANCNNISGMVFNDENENGIKDPLEQGIAEQLVKLEPGPSYTTTDNNGYYWFAADIGTHIITYITQPYWNLTTDSLNYTATIIDTNHVSGLDFGVKAMTNVQDVRISLTGGPVRPGFLTNYWLSYKNMGTQTMSGIVYHEYVPALTYLNSIPSENVHSGNILEYYYDTLASHEERMIISHFQVPVSLNIGDIVISYCRIEPLTGDIEMVNNFDTLIQVVTGSYDPNDKSVSPTGVGAEGYVLHGQRLTYTIRFQNTGTDTAFTIVVKDTLDTDMNIETFNLIASSHPVSYDIQGTGIINFVFNNVLLPDSNVNEQASNGFVKYSIEPKASLYDFTEVKNKAYIYFDYNTPVLTNEVLNTYVTTITSIKETGKKVGIKVFPNPASDIVTLNINNANNSDLTLNIYNVIGKLVSSETLLQNQKQIFIDDLSNGLYIVEIKSKEWSEKQKLIIQR